MRVLIVAIALPTGNASRSTAGRSTGSQVFVPAVSERSPSRADLRAIITMPSGVVGDLFPALVRGFEVRVGAGE